MSWLEAPFAALFDLIITGKVAFCTSDAESFSVTLLWKEEICEKRK